MRIITREKLELARSSVESRVASSCYLNLPNSLQGSPLGNDLKFAIECMVQNALRNGFNELFNQLYTQEEFEHDLGISS